MNNQHNTEPDIVENEGSLEPASRDDSVLGDHVEPTGQAPLHNPFDENSTSDDRPIVAEIVGDGQGRSPGDNNRRLPKHGLRPTPAPLPPNFENLAAVGGAVGSIVLGIWAILGSLLTPYSMINGFMGIVMGLWGLRSRKRWLAAIGIMTSILGIMMSAMEVSEFLESLWAVEEEF